MNRLAAYVLTATFTLLGAAPLRAEIHVLARDGFQPFSEQQWLGQGLAVELLQAALARFPQAEPVSLSWDDDPNRLLRRTAASQTDIAFPVAYVACGDATPDALCRDFHFSDPLLDIVTLLFVRAKDQFPFETDADLEGRMICRPIGYGTEDLTGLLRTMEFTLVRAGTIDACFQQLMAGQVDAVAVNEFFGVAKLFDLSLTSEVVPLSRPLSQYSLHAVAAKTHWRATAHIHRVNHGLVELHQSGDYARIVEKHLNAFWSEVRKQRQ